MYLSGGKTCKNLGKVSDKIINKVYAEYKQRKLTEKGEKPGNISG